MEQSVSILFLADGDGARLWNPSNMPGRIFKGHAEVIAAEFNLPSGLGEIIEDEVFVDVPLLETFLTRLVRQYDYRGHFIIMSLIGAVLGTSYVLVERAGGRLPEIDPQRAPAWEAQHLEFSRSMPR
jgi:Family of unknown function (DUF6086)